MLGWCGLPIVEAQSQSDQKPSLAHLISQAKPGDTLYLTAGYYQEHSIIIDKPLTILADGEVIIDAKGEAKDVFVITADSVTLSGLQIRNVATSFLSETSAIRVKNSRDCHITNNQITNCFFGIYLEYTSYSTITGNTIAGTSREEGTAGNAIHAWKGHHLTITENKLTGHRDGIYFEFVDDSRIAQNRSEQNLRYGLHFMFSNRDEYKRNTFRNNGAGVAVMFSKNIAMLENKFQNNWGGAAYGLLLKEISDGSIERNLFEHNTIGVLAEGANRLHIYRNQFTSNGTAMDIKGNCLDNQVESNNFLANTFEVVTNSKYNNNSYLDNYWSGYAGYDLNRDGIGDIPYRPVNLFAKITHEIPAATIMLHSTFVNLLEMGEKIFPQLIPVELIDPSPKMKPYRYD